MLTQLEIYRHALQRIADHDYYGGDDVHSLGVIAKEALAQGRAAPLHHTTQGGEQLELPLEEPPSYHREAGFAHEPTSVCDSLTVQQEPVILPEPDIAEICAILMNHLWSGNSDFVMSLCNQLHAKKRWTPKQASAALGLVTKSRSSTIKEIDKLEDLLSPLLPAPFDPNP